MVAVWSPIGAADIVDDVDDSVEVDDVDAVPSTFSTSSRAGPSVVVAAMGVTIAAAAAADVPATSVNASTGAAAAAAAPSVDAAEASSAAGPAPTWPYHGFRNMDGRAAVFLQTVVWNTGQFLGDRVPSAEEAAYSEKKNGNG